MVGARSRSMMPPDAVHPELAAVILVGGRSERMGRPKVTLELAGRPLLAHVLAVIRPLVREVILVAAPDQTIPPALTSGPDDAFPIRIVHDRVVAAGPLPALALGLAAVTTDLAIALPCDAPFVRAALVTDLARRLAAADAGALQAVIPTWGGHLQPLVAAYRPRVARELDALVARGETRLQSVGQLREVVILAEDDVRAFDPAGESFRVLNTPADLAAAERVLAAGADVR
jgi:molybdopterin-guanine dinucleotide biosynthesis protein A